jgi:hypothetical protein
MSHVYIVEVHYDYETHATAGIFSSKEIAEKVADEYRQAEIDFDGVHVKEEEVYDNYEDWNKQFDEVD